MGKWLLKEIQNKQVTDLTPEEKGGKKKRKFELLQVLF